MEAFLLSHIKAPAQGGKAGGANAQHKFNKPKAAVQAFDDDG
jgi:hypothetical protein